MSKFSIKNRYIYTFGIQAITVFLLYIFLPGRVSQTLTAFQPDSINSLCMGISRFHSNLHSVQAILSSVAKTFYVSGIQLACSPDLTPPYRTRFILSLQMGLFSLLGPWWFVLLPSVLIYFCIGFIYWLIVKRYFEFLTFKDLIWFIPFFSPHLGWFLANVMTEGPLFLFLILITYVTYIRKINILLFEVTLVSFLCALALLTKQSWPLVTVVLAAYLVNRFTQFAKVLVYGFSLVLSLAGSSIVKHLGESIYGKDFGKWNDLAIFLEPIKASKGVFLGLRADFNHLFAFADIFGIVGICGAIWLTLFKIINIEIKITLLTALAWGLATIGSVYLADGSYGQNWRFMVFAFVLAYPLYLIDKELKDQVDYSQKV